MTTKQQVVRQSARIVLTVLALCIVVGAAVGVGGIKYRHGQFLSVQTGSMQPTIRRGDLVVVLPYGDQSIRRGDIVTFRSAADPNQTITHRIVTAPSANRKAVQTKGDANAVADRPITTSAVIGRVAYTLPKAGYVSDFVRTPAGLALLIYVPALFVISGELRRLIRYYRAQQPYVLRGYRRRS